MKMGLPEVLNQNSLDMCSSASKSDHVEKTSKKNGTTPITVIDFSLKSIYNFPQIELSSHCSLNSVTVLCLSHNNLMTIPFGLHTILPNLQVFRVNENELSELPEDISELQFLQEVHICKNKLTSVPHSLYKLKYLRILNVSGNKLKRLHPEIGQNKCLEELYVSDNLLKRFPATFGLLVNLHVLEAANNQLEIIPQTINLLVGLQVVNLKCNKLSTLPDSFSLLANLKHLDLSGNRISNLWQSCASTHTLETILLNSNSIKELPSWFSQLTNVRQICVANNNLRHSDSFPLDFGERLQCLIKLDLRGNFIETLPPSLSNLTCLQSLLLGVSTENEDEDDNNGDHHHVCQNSNWIAAFPNNFTDLRHLVFLAAEENQFISLPEDFGCLVLLKDLRLGGNLLSSLPNSFCKLQSLERCQLSKNNLRVLPEDFGRLDGLKELYLDCNRLKCLPLSMKNCVQLEIIDLRGNRFSEAQPDLLKVLSRLEDLRLIQDDCQSDSNNCAGDSDDDLDSYDYSASPQEDAWDDTGSSTHHVSSVKDDEENWDIDTCQTADNESNKTNSNEADSGRFELDGEERAQCRSTGTTFDVYGNPSQRIDLTITQHRMLPYLLHRPRNVWGQRESSPELVEEQYDDAV